ncbi:MAG: IS200/IS605 family accessory protein TnpB-related protein [Acidilobaceae archaeon]
MYDKLYGVRCRVKRKIMRRLNEGDKKSDIRWKIANIIVREAAKRGYAIVMEKLGKRPAENMIESVKDKQFRHRIYQASLKGVQRAIDEKERARCPSTIQRTEEHLKNMPTT